MKNDLIYLKHIKESVESIFDFAGKMEYKDFSRNRMVVSAVVRELEIIGEAANNVSQKFRDSHPEIPWRDMVEMRNVLIHEYFGVVVETVWKTIQKDLPPLEKEVEKILA